MEDRQQPMNPIVHARLTQAKEFAHDDLKGISLEVDQEEQQLIFRPMQDSLAASASGPLAGSICSGLVLGIQSLIGRREGGQQKLKLRERQAGEGQKLPTIALECCVGDHAAIVTLISDNVY